MRPPRRPARFASLIASLSVLLAATVARATNDFPALIRFFLQRDVRVLSVTDMTDAGRAYPTATPAEPIRYKLIYVGQVNFGRAWGGETLPTKRNTLDWIMGALKDHGYLLADATHPPEQLFVFGWGMLDGGESRPALGFLGGDKVNLMWEQEQYGGFLNPNVLRRGLFHLGVAGKVWDFSESPLFLGVVRSFTLDSQDTAKPVTKLWETRFACPSTGLAFNETMPLLIKAAAPNFGRETNKPVLLNATEAFGGTVKLHELEILGEEKKPAAGKNLAPDAQ
jgi:hypothetical protein